jgi:four helix bundle protein
MNHQKLKCYCVLLAVARKLPTLTENLPKGTYYLEDQLERALASAILNLSEGNGRRSTKERNRFFDISLASIAETASALDIIHALGHITQVFNEEIKSELRMAYAMIMRLRR